MGTIHRSKERFNFRTLDGTRDAYISSFRRDPAKVKAAIEEQTLDALSQMRHVIVHNGSRVDDKFKTEGGKVPILSKWTSLPLGTPINLDGQEAVEVLIVPALKTAVRLIQAVDEWLTNNP